MSDEYSVAISLADSVERGERDRLDETTDSGLNGARAALETFYHSLNTRSLTLLRQIWADDPLVQLDNPVGGITRGLDAIVALYARIFEGPVRVTVELWDIVQFATPEMVVFAGRERGRYVHDGKTVPLDIRTSRIFRYFPNLGWRQVHHHGSIDDPDQLAAYQRAVRGNANPAGGDAAGSADGSQEIVRQHLLTGAFHAHIDRIEAHRVMLQPGQKTGRHFHAGGTVGYIEAGTVAFAVDGETPMTLTAGDVFCEPPQTRIAQFDNVSPTEPAIFVAFYPLTGDQPLITTDQSE